jgi:hypothetical protein
MTALKCARLFIITAIVVLKPLCVSAALSGAPFTPTASLPSLFVLQNGTNVITPAQWAARRVELRTLVQEHILGRSTHALLHDQHCTTHTYMPHALHCTRLGGQSRAARAPTCCAQNSAASHECARCVHFSCLLQAPRVAGHDTRTHSLARALAERTHAGTLPPPDATPTLTKATLINASDASSPSEASDGFAWAFVSLEFDANGTEVTFPIELMWRVDVQGKIPVVLTQWSECSTNDPCSFWPCSTHSQRPLHDCNLCASTDSARVSACCIVLKKSIVCRHPLPNLQTIVCPFNPHSWHALRAHPANRPQELVLPRGPARVVVRNVSRRRHS